MDEGAADAHSRRAIRGEVVRHRRRTEERLCLRRLLRHSYRTGWPLPTDRQARELGLCVRDGVRRREDPAHDEDLACGIGHEGARVDLISGGFVPTRAFAFLPPMPSHQTQAEPRLLLSRLDPEMDWR